MGVGAWLIARVHTVVDSCRALSNPIAGTGLATTCQANVDYYYVGFALTLGGLIILVLATFGTVKRRRDQRARHERARVAKMEMEKRDPFRNAA